MEFGVSIFFTNYPIMPSASRVNITSCQPGKSDRISAEQLRQYLTEKLANRGFSVCPWTDGQRGLVCAGSQGLTNFRTNSSFGCGGGGVFFSFWSFLLPRKILSPPRPKPPPPPPSP